MTNWRALMASAALGAGCANGIVTEPMTTQRLLPLGEPASLDGSAICKDLGGRFIGLPALEQASKGSSKMAPALAGRWWIRGCSAHNKADGLELRLQGPGWYWVDATGSGITVKEQVPFRLSLELVGRLHQTLSEGVLALWLEPTSEPLARVDAPPALKVQSVNAWGQLVQLVPFVSAEETAAERFSQALSGALRQQLRAGATLTYDVRSGQSDATVGRLPPGQTPLHPFPDGSAWLVNDRLLLPPASTQVMGPVPAGTFAVDAIVERGPGLTYRAICTDDMSASYAAIASGTLLAVPTGVWVAAGTITGVGQHSTSLEVNDCPFYLVVSTLQGATTAALRLR